MKKRLMFAITTAGILILGSFSFLSSTNAQEVQTTTTIATNVVTNTVANKTLSENQNNPKTPVVLPPDAAMRFASNYFNCDFVKKDQILFGMRDVSVVYYNQLKDIISDDEMRAKFELTLRKSSVPINPASGNLVSLDWTVVRSCSLFQPKNIGVATAGQADFGCEKFLEGNAFG